MLAIARTGSTNVTLSVVRPPMPMETAHTHAGSHLDQPTMTALMKMPITIREMSAERGNQPQQSPSLHQPHTDTASPCFHIHCTDTQGVCAHHCRWQTCCTIRRGCSSGHPSTGSWHCWRSTPRHARPRDTGASQPHAALARAAAVVSSTEQCSPPHEPASRHVQVHHRCWQHALADFGGHCSKG